MNRLSTPRDQLKEHYDVVVIGSGYGGAICASRLARAGKRVCLLERGKEYLPGEFPNSEKSALQEMQIDLPDDHLGSPLGLFDLRVNEEMNVVVGCGLGGTSLINANVALRADPRLFDDQRWPSGLRRDIGSLLEECYGHAEAMLKPTPYDDLYGTLPKLAALQRSAVELGASCQRPPINVCFTEGINHVGVEQHVCVLCGDCVSGCNHGAKNTLAMNYLPDAHNHGAEIHTQIAVLRLERRAERWLIYYQPLGVGRERFASPEMFLHADVVILAAGSLGSSEILLRSREAGLAMSAMVGRRFTSNGDVVGFGYNNRRPINGIGFGDLSAEGRAAVGPCISGVIDLRDSENPDEGMVIEEGALPGALARILPLGFSTADILDGRDPQESFSKKASKWWRTLVSAVAGPYHGAVHNTQTYLVMAHDDGCGEMSLRDDRLRIDWPDVGEQPVFHRIDRTLIKATRATGGDYIANPLWSKQLGHRLVTVHPLGGAAMAENAEHGVVNHKGQLFCSTAGDDIYRDLYVCDGSIMPRSLGVNPLLTISALAERCAALIAGDRGWSIDYRLPSSPAEVRSPTLGIRFTETMAGTLTAKEGRAASDFRFILTIESDDMEAMLTSPGHRAALTGTVTAPLLDSEPLTVNAGTFALFIKASDAVETKEMVYRMTMASSGGDHYFMEGVKRIHDDPGFDLWQDTTTLFITVRQHDKEGPVVATGVLRIAAEDFMRQLTTMQLFNARNKREELEGLARFGRFFAGSLFDSYGGLFAGPTPFNADAPSRVKRPLRAPVPQIYTLHTTDGVQLRLTRYCGGAKGPVMLSHGLGVASTIFTIDTIDTNLLEYLVAHGYDVWLLDYRASIELPSAKEQFSGDEIARYDYPAAVAEIRRISGAETIQVVAHCFGATTFAMAMLAGLQGVRSAVFSQVATHFSVPLSTQVKTGLHMPSMLELLGVHSLTAYVDNHTDWKERLYDLALNLSPSEEGEQCRSATCHRISFMYAPLYRHNQLNEATHEALHEMFGVANITAFEHIAAMVREKHVVASDGRDDYLLHPERLAIPLLLIHGAENRCFLPESTEQTLRYLADANGAGLYSRRLIPGYGHIDTIFGKEAARDVYPYILEHLEK